ncbi:cysteine desulfurase [Homoserinimonas aerilata]|uniref:cysteine desulfurase n=1 Tax=Homoserinimonas aerilata TaxID=1162970 RepID=A0A542YID6_9MICO|nr:cysteine desulfurase family protein [Homoserinimonas aerilata]TQL47855.1 cysteine desulfurase [Homoserinimonas aerilata]
MDDAGPLYLDHAATSPVRREVLEAMWPYLSSEFGNPSSHHAAGESAARALDWARSTVAAVLGCRASEIVFTGGGTEANNLAIKGVALARPRGRHVVISAVEHPSVLESCAYLERFHGFEVARLPVDSYGLVAPADFEAALHEDTTLASVMYANNEIGTVQPIAELAGIGRAVGVPFHSDAVQAAGWLPLDVDGLGVDALTLAGHKLGAPKGIGVLFCRARIPLEPVLHGGGQERGRRSGTQDVAGAVGLATALVLADDERKAGADALGRLRDEFIARILAGVQGSTLTGHPSLRLAGSASFCFAGTSGEAVLLELERRGVLVSSGSACAAGSSDPSPVLLAIGVEPELAQTAVRFTFGAQIERAQLLAVADAVEASVAAVRGIR